MKTVRYITAVAVSMTSITFAASVTDDFNRENTVAGAKGEDIGANWVVVSDKTGFWGIKDNTVRVKSRASSANGAAILYNSAEKTLNTADHSFTFSGDMIAGETDKQPYAGIVFNYNPAADSYYTLRVRINSTRYQLVAYQGTNVLVAGTFNDASAPFNAGESYTFTVSSSDSPGTVEFTISKTGDTAALNPVHTYTFSTVLKDGYAGFYAGTSGNYTYDNFKLEAK